MAPGLISEKEEVRTYCVFVQRGQGGGAVSVQVVIRNVVRAHVRVVQAVPVSGCGAQKRRHAQTVEYKRVSYEPLHHTQKNKNRLPRNSCTGDGQRGSGR